MFQEKRIVAKKLFERIWRMWEKETNHQNIQGKMRNGKREKEKVRKSCFHKQMIFVAALIKIDWWLFKQRMEREEKRIWNISHSRSKAGSGLDFSSFEPLWVVINGPEPSLSPSNSLWSHLALLNLWALQEPRTWEFNQALPSLWKKACKLFQDLAPFSYR